MKPDQIVAILHSITKLSFDELGVLEAWFEDQETSMVASEFLPGSFTKELLELIERHMNKEIDQ